MKKWTIGVTFLLVACGVDRGDAELTVREEVWGDTAVVISSGDPPAFEATSVTVTWQSDALGNPRSLAKVGEYLVVGDGYRVHVLNSEGEHQRTFGRRGEGPGELVDVYSVGGFGDDTVAVFDGRLLRVSLYSPDGQFVVSRSATPAPLFGNPRVDPPFVRWGPGVLFTATGNITPGQPRQLAAIWHDLEADSTAVLETWNDMVFEELAGGIFGSRDLFPSRAIVAISRDGRIAEGNGRDYCVRVRSVKDPEVGMWCREGARLPVGPGIRSPDPALLEGDPQADGLLAQWRDQDPGASLPPFDRLLFSHSGELWVRTYDESFPDIHPGILGRRPDLAPPTRRWEVFDPEGRLAREVTLPFLFRPHVILEDRILGFWPLETGEVTIGRVSLDGERVES